MTSLKQIAHAASRLRAASARRDAARYELRKAIEAARKEHTLAEIGEVLGMTRQGVYDIIKPRR